MLPDAEIIQDPTPEAALYGGTYSEPPTLRDAALAEGTVLRAIRVRRDPVAMFAAFLDGAQQVRILSHRHGVPILLGTVSAVVRVRQNRRLVTWGHRAPEVRRRLYMPLRYLPALDGVRDGVTEDGYEIVDTAMTDERGEWPPRHPAALRACALERIRGDRERLESQLAEAWCARESAPLCIDGPIGGNSRVATSACAVGVIKSHQTLYADGDALDVVMRLRRGERTSMFKIGGRSRTGVVSWYLRVREPAGQDAMFGLVRVEVAACDDVSERADEVSSWVLAEGTPLALPDARWDKMMYGVRDCEEFLKAIST
jgi:hypothetical protein